MNLFEFSDYRALIRGVLEARKQEGWSLNFRKLADAARIQRSYLSKVLNADAHLSADQAFLLSNALGLNQGDREFFLMLLEKDRTALPERKKLLIDRIKKLRDRKRDSEEYLEETESLSEDETTQMQFYLDPLHLIVQISLTIDRYAKHPERLAGDLGLPITSIMNSIQKLLELKIIKKEKGIYRVLKDRTHLPKDSPYYRAWSQQLAFLAKHKIQLAREQSPYSFSVVFSADESVREKIHYRFLEYIREVENLTKDAALKEVYHLNFDLFTWTKN